VAGIDCKHKWKVIRDLKSEDDKVKIHKCELCGEEMLEINGFVHKRRVIKFPEQLL